MRRRSIFAVCGALLALALPAAPAFAVHDGTPDATGMTQLSNWPNQTGAVNSDLAFWGNRAFAGNYDGFRIFDISNPAAPVQLVDFRCRGPQSDPVVWGNLLFLAIDTPQIREECSADAPDREAPTAWEGVRIFDVSNPAAPRFVKGVFTDCGAHTITLYPKNPAQVMIYVSSYPLRSGPTCGPTRGPAAGNSPLHEKISVIRVPVNNPEAAKVVAEPRVSYPGDPDNTFDPQEHGFPETDAAGSTFNDLTACHDIGVFVELRLAGAACAEQAQLWRIKPNGIPDTEHPVWIYDDNSDTDGPGSMGTTGDVAVDFWHSATFSWDGKVVNFIDESFGSGCPTVTEWSDGSVNDTGRMFFLDTATGQKLSHFAITRPGETEYCSAHLGIPVHTPDAYLLVNSWYTGGADVIDFNDPTNPFEATFFDAGPGGEAGSDNWTAYWYEGPALPGSTLTMYGQDGVEHPPSGLGFQVFSAATDVRDVALPFLNPQTQMNVIGSGVRLRPGNLKPKGKSIKQSKAGRSGGQVRAGRAADRRLGP
jgi:hypothetical protein